MAPRIVSDAIASLLKRKTTGAAKLSGRGYKGGGAITKSRKVSRET
jgi:hypothetical protein